jgi:GT2 family glycosyltransferase
VNRAPVAVVVAAHRHYPTLELCLRGFREIVAFGADLIFVDNGSGGVLADWVGRRFPDITILTLGENRLFCGGYNAGIRCALERCYEYVLIANADTEVVNPAFLIHLVDAMERHPQAAFVGPLVYHRRPGTVQTTCLRFPSLLRSLLVWLPFRMLPRAVFRQGTRECEADFLNGVCVLCRAQALRQIGLMDETFGAYVEDTDWGWRARTLGWKSVFIPVPSIVHHEKRHGYEHYSRKSFLLKRNTVYWFVKVGRRGSARGYAAAAVILARCRALAAAKREAREEHRDFACRLHDVYRRFLSGERTRDGCGLPREAVAPCPCASAAVAQRVPDAP